MKNNGLKILVGVPTFAVREDYWTNDIVNAESLQTVNRQLSLSRAKASEKSSREKDNAMVKQNL